MSSAAQGRRGEPLGGLGPTFHAIAVLTVGVLPVFMSGALAVQMEHDLHFGTASLGIAVAAFFAAGALCSAAAGHLSERLGPTRLMRASALLAGGAMAGVAAAAHSWGELVAIMGVAGIANGVSQPPINQFLAERVPAARQGLAFGIKQAAIPLSTLLGGLSVPLVGLTVGWRWAFVGGAALAIGVAARVPAAEPSVRGIVEPRPAARDPIRYAPLLVLGTAVALGTGAANALGAFLVASTVHVLRASAVHVAVAKGEAGLLAALGGAVGLAVRLAAGAVGDRVRTRHFEVVAGMLAVGSLGYAFLASGTVWLLIPAAVIAYGAGWGWNGLFTFAVVRNHPGAPARATGITQTGVYVGGVLGPLAFGLTADRASFAAAWAGMAVAAVVAAAGIVVGRRMLARGLAGETSGRT